MHKAIIPAVLLLTAFSAVPTQAQRRGAGAGTVTFAVSVQDPAGAPVPEVRVTLTGPMNRTGRTEGGRLVFEGLPAGAYRLTFEKEGFATRERELSGRGGAPIDVKITLTPLPPPPAPPPASEPEPVHTVDAKLVVLDMPAFIEKYYVGRAAGKTTPVACATGGGSTLLQMNEPLAEHAHADADEFLYVIAGQGAARMGQRVEPLGPGVFMMIPRGTSHTLTPALKKPLVVLSIRAGEKCG